MNEPSELLTYAEFRAYAEAHEGRFEFVDGRAVAMANPSDAHQDLASALLEALNPHLRSLGCRVRLAGTLWTGENERVPDGLAICDGQPRKLVCEILSPNRGDDLTRKLAEYQAMPAFEEYLVLDSTRRWVRVYRRGTEGLFVFNADHLGGTVPLASIAYTLDIDALYDAAGVR